MLVGFAFAVAASAAATAQAAVPRTVPVVAEIVSVRGDERLRFIDDAIWRTAVVRQDLATGDTLQTGPYGGLSLLFRDATQIRVHRNTTLVVKAVRTRAGAGRTELRLERGAAWSRTRGGPDELRMETPSATAAIRGTDWHMRVADDGRSTLVVLAGVVEFANPFGAVTVTRGEIAFAEVGKPPTKTFLLNPRDRPQWEIVFTPDWLRMLPVTGLTPGALRRREAELAARPDADRDADVLLERAEIAYERGDADAARALLAKLDARGDPAAGSGRRRLLDALLLAQALALDEADRAFLQAIPGLAGRPRLIAELGRFGVLLVAGRYADAEATLTRLPAEAEQFPELALARVMLQSYRGEQERALETAAEAGRRFPSDSRFPLWTSHVSLLLDEPERMRRAFEEALARDPEQYLAWHVAGTYHHFVVPDFAAAERAYARVLEIVPLYAPTWNNLALLRLEQGDWTGARAAIQRAMALAPRDPLYKATYAALLVLAEERLAEGEAVAREALALDPTHAPALQALGSVALRQGRDAEAIAWMLRATGADPGLAGATTNLAIAYYQAGEFDAAMRTIQDAIRLDPNDAVAPLVASLFAQDQAEAGVAIRHAREAMDRALRLERLDIDRFATNQGGFVNLGSAYTALGLDDWGAYYGHLSFDPATAASHFFAANEYDSPRARRSEAVQGLLLDPLAVSSRARYYDLVRRPFVDVTLGASVGAEDGELMHGQRGLAQGFARVPFPLSWAVDLRRDHHDGFRENSQSTSERGVIGVGARVRPEHDLVLLVSGGRTSLGIPGPVDGADPDDRVRNEDVEASLGYHLRLGADDHVLLRAGGRYIHQRFLNDAPFGSNVSDLTLSLLRAFGLGTTRAIYAAGLCQPVPGVPAFAIGPICTILGLPGIPSDLPATIDLKSVESVDTEQTSLLLQGRHLFRLGPVRLTYGADWSPAHVVEVRRDIGFEPTGPAAIIGVPFTLGTAARIRGSRRRDTQAAQGYVGGEWRATPALRVETALFVRHFDDDEDISTTQPDPRAGIAWQPVRGHWLRVAGQRDLVLPLEGSLASVAAVSLLNRDDFTAAGSSTTTYQGRWDAEWSSRVFTFLAADHQRIRRFFAPIPLSLTALTAEKGEIDGVTVGANLWLLERWGLFAQHRWTWTENVSKGPDRGRDLPLIPERLFEAGIAWVHPLQIRGNLAAVYVGPRAGDVGNTTRLDGYWTANANVNWQPAGKRWSLSLAMNNLFDERYEVAPGFPAPGFTVAFAVEYRFGGTPRP